MPGPMRKMECCCSRPHAVLQWARLESSAWCFSATPHGGWIKPHGSIEATNKCQAGPWPTTPLSSVSAIPAALGKPRVWIGAICLNLPNIFDHNGWPVIPYKRATIGHLQTSRRACKCSRLYSPTQTNWTVCLMSDDQNTHPATNILAESQETWIITINRRKGVYH